MIEHILAWTFLSVVAIVAVLGYLYAWFYLYLDCWRYNDRSTWIELHYSILTLVLLAAFFWSVSIVAS